MQRSFFVDADTDQYVRQSSERLSSAQRDLVEHSKLVSPHLVGGEYIAQHIQIMLKAMRARRVLLLGCFTGYTASALAQALPDDDKDCEVLVLDTTDKYVDWRILERMNVAHKVYSSLLLYILLYSAF